MTLSEAFATYFEEIERCRNSRCYWSLLHVLAVLPDICAAMEYEDGASHPDRYRNWCKRYFERDKAFTPSDRYALRCALLHQGRTVTDHGQYGSYSFMQPTATGEIIAHRVAYDFGGSRPNFSLDVSKLATETVTAMHRWFEDLRKPENEARLTHAVRNVRWLARQGLKEASVVSAPPGGIIVIAHTTSSTGGFGS